MSEENTTAGKQSFIAEARRDQIVKAAIKTLVSELRQILRDGQEQGVFGSFHISVMANMIQGAIGEYMFDTSITKEVDLETYSNELVQIVQKAVNVSQGAQKSSFGGAN